MFGTLYLTAMLAAALPRPVVEVEEVVATVVPPNNGAGPLWAYGAPLLVRRGSEVLVSVMETGEDIPPLANTRPRLFRRDDGGSWELRYAPEDFREREPAPLVALADGRLFLSINPLIDVNAPRRAGPSDPQLLAFSPDDPDGAPVPDRPDWEAGARFTEHSYRGFAADARAGELLVLNIDSPTGDQFWAYRDATGTWARHGRIAFPIRACYPQVALRGGAGHVLAIGDIVEPVEEWRQYKHAQTGRDWDYVFRRLFYTWTPDIRQRPFAEPIEIDELEKTAGYIRNLDLWIDDDGAAHLLYTKQTVQSALMRDRFFPDVPITISLEHVVVKDGRIASRSTLLRGGEGVEGEVVRFARFHATDEGELYVVYTTARPDASGRNVPQNRLLRLFPEGETESVQIPLTEPFGTFFTATERGGSPPSKTLDLFGTGSDGTVLRYARVRIP